MKAYQVGFGLIVLLAAGCAGPDDGSGAVSADSAGQGVPVGNGSAALSHYGRFRPRSSGSGGTPASGSGGSPSATSTGGAAATAGSDAGTTFTCSICTQANDCCNAVGGGALCTFSAATCSAETSPTAQQAYITNCLSLLRTTAQAWTSVGATPPAVCSL